MLLLFPSEYKRLKGEGDQKGYEYNIANIQPPQTLHCMSIIHAVTDARTEARGPTDLRSFHSLGHSHNKKLKQTRAVVDITIEIK